MLFNNKYLEVDFEDFSPQNMHGLLYSTFDEKKSPLILTKEINEKIISKVEFINHLIKYLIKLKKEEPLKLTQKGNLPRKFCTEFLFENFSDDKSRTYLEKNPIRSEEESLHIRLINFLTAFAGFTKKNHGKKFLTKKCTKKLSLNSSYSIYRDIFLSYIKKFNWGYFDYYPESLIIQNGFGFSMFLVQKYGDKQREVKFYSDKFLRAFPTTINDFSNNTYSTKRKQFDKCYYIRTFERFLYRFGLIHIKKEGKYPSEQRFIMKTDLLDALIKWKM
ncbi:MAG: hypothetical protein K8S23_01310 [Candidatus Cloacimonetes bacterium]|nr:hypothetical protein [Candidatus Cloacimonadota bacterium]